MTFRVSGGLPGCGFQHIIDPICRTPAASAEPHCQIAAYWSKELGRSVIDAYQASSRGGRLRCEMLGNGRIATSGEAALVAVSDIVVDLCGPVRRDDSE